MNGLVSSVLKYAEELSIFCDSIFGLYSLGIFSVKDLVDPNEFSILIT